MSLFKKNVILVPNSISFHLITFAQFLFISFSLKWIKKKDPRFSLSKKNFLKINDIILRTDATFFEAKYNFDVTFYMPFHFLVGFIIVCI